MAAKKPTNLARLAVLAGNAKRRSANVRELARFAANSTCPLAAAGFATRVDFDHLLQGTDLAAPYGQSPFAFRRGNTFEELLRKDGHAPLLGLLKDNLHYNIAGAQVANVREGQPKNKAGLEARAKTTEQLVKTIVTGAKNAPNLIDGAVLGRTIGGSVAYFEADAVAAQFGRPIHVGEVKSFPTVDGQADPDKIGAAVAQVSIYILLLRELVEKVGGNPDLVSTQALLITAKNTGLQPTLCVKPVGREVDRARRILDQVPDVESMVGDLPAKIPSFETVTVGIESARLDRLSEIADAIGTEYRPACLSSCGLSRFCRERAHASGDPARMGGQLLRLLPGIDSIDRVSKLVANIGVKPEEKPVAEQLQRAATLRALLAPPPAAPARRVKA